MKKTLSTILTFLAVISLLSACGNEPTQTNNTSGSAENSSVAAAANDTASTAQPTDPAEVETSPLHTIYFNDCTKSSDATATFFNSITKETKDVPMKKESEDDIKNGRVMTIEESKARLMQEYEYLNLE